jgi:hypothetical protein
LPDPQPFPGLLEGSINPRGRFELVLGAPSVLQPHIPGSTMALAHPDWDF